MSMTTFLDRTFVWSTELVYEKLFAKWDSKAKYVEVDVINRFHSRVINLH